MERDEGLEESMWDEFKKTPTKENQEMLFDYYIPLAEQVAMKYASAKNIWRELDEITQYALISLLNAIKIYDRSKSNFISYGYSKIWFGIIDFIRKNSKVDMRSKYKINEISLEYLMSEDYKEMDFNIEYHGKSYSQYENEANEVGEIIDNSKMKEKEKYIAKLYFIDNYTHGEAGSMIGVKNGRIGQMINRVIIPIMKQELLDNYPEMVNNYRRI